MVSKQAQRFGNLQQLMDEIEVPVDAGPSYRYSFSDALLDELNWEELAAEAAQHTQPHCFYCGGEESGAVNP